MEWYFVCMTPKKAIRINSFPLVVGRNPTGLSAVKLEDPTIPGVQFAITSMLGKIYYLNKSQNNPAVVDGVEVADQVRLDPGIHIIHCGALTIGIGTDYEPLCEAVSSETTEYYIARVNGQELGPWTIEQVLEACENGVLGRDSKLWHTYDPATIFKASDLVDFSDPATEAVIE